MKGWTYSKELLEGFGSGDSERNVLKQPNGAGKKVSAAGSFAAMPPTFGAAFTGRGDDNGGGDNNGIPSISRCLTNYEDTKKTTKKNRKVRAVGALTA